MSEILKSCPFCGSDKVDGMFIRDGWRIGCRDCGAGVPAYHPNAHTVSADKWNRRSDAAFEERDRLREENTLLRNASWRLMVAANDVDLGRSIHNSRKPDDVIEGPVWVILRNASAEVRAALSPPTPEGSAS